MRWSEKWAKQTALTCPKKATKYDIRGNNPFIIQTEILVDLTLKHTI